MVEKPILYNFIIIGAGLAGLTVAYYLAKNGIKVTVFEHSNIDG